MEGSLRNRNGKWYYSFEIGKVDGKRKRMERVAKGARTKSEAEAIMREKIEEYENTGTLFQVSEITLHDYLQLWMKEYVEVNLKANTQANYRLTINNHISPALGGYKIKVLTPRILQNFLAGKVKEGLSRQTISIIRGILNKSLNHAVHTYGYIERNPITNIDIMMPRGRKPTKETLKIQSKENLRILIDNIDEHHPFYIPFYIGLYCGLRVGELCGLEWKHIDFVEGTIEIEQQLTLKDRKWIVSSPKSIDSYRVIPVGNKLVDILKKEYNKQVQNELTYGEGYRKDSQHNFVCRKPTGEHYTPAVIKYHTGVLISKKLGIELNYHSLRHTHATTLIENGAKMKAVQKRLGHSRSSVTEQYYIHLTEKMSREAVDIFENFTDEL